MKTYTYSRLGATYYTRNTPKKGATMKTLADLKRKLTLGTVVVMTWHRHQGGMLVHSNLGPVALPSKLTIGAKRTVVKVRSKEVGFHSEDREPGQVSWMTFPKASHLRIDSENSFTILSEGDDQPLMSYAIQ